MVTLGFYAPPAIGAVVVAIPGSQAQRSIGLGILLGWPAGWIIVGGLCAAALAGGAPPSPNFRLG